MNPHFTPHHNITSHRTNITRHHLSLTLSQCPQLKSSLAQITITNTLSTITHLLVQLTHHHYLQQNIELCLNITHKHLQMSHTTYKYTQYSNIRET